MYVQAACDLPNSSTPMAAGAVTAQDQWIAAVGSDFTSGNKALNQLISSLGGNPPSSMPAPGNAGVPTIGPTGVPLGSPVVSVLSPTGAVSGNLGPAAAVATGPNASVVCSPPELLPLVTIFPIPTLLTPSTLLAPSVSPSPPAPAPQSAPVTAPIIATPAPPPPAAVPAPAAVDPNSCRTGNICLDLLNGCVSSTQVTPQQQLACSLAGYAGNRNRYPAIAALPGKPFLGFPDPNPVQYNSGMGQLGGLGAVDWSLTSTDLIGQFGLAVPNWIVYAGVIGAWAIMRGSFDKGKRR